MQNECRQQNEGEVQLGYIERTVYWVDICGNSHL